MIAESVICLILHWTSLKLLIVSLSLILHKHVFYVNKTMHYGLKVQALATSHNDNDSRNAMTGACAFTAQIFSADTHRSDAQLSVCSHLNNCIM